MKNSLAGFRPAPMKTNHLLPFLGVGLFFLLMSCSSIHKLSNKKVAKENSIDKSITNVNAQTQIIATEKADTTIKIKSDTATINLVIPSLAPDNTNNPVPSPSERGWGEADTAGTDQSIESGTIKITIHTKPIFSNGKKSGTLITATAIKKPDSIHVVIDKKTITNVTAQTQTKNNIQTSKSEKEVNKTVEKKRFNLAGLVATWGLLILLLLAAYYYLKKKKIL